MHTRLEYYSEITIYSNDTAKVEGESKNLKELDIDTSTLKFTDNS